MADRWLVVGADLGHGIEEPTFRRGEKRGHWAGAREVHESETIVPKIGRRGKPHELLGQTLDSRLTSNGRPIIFLVGKDPPDRQSLESLIRREVWQLETFQSAQELLARTRPLVPNCLILALSVPDLNDLEAQKQIARERPETLVIFTANYADTPTIVQAMKAGAANFLVKPFTDDVLVSAIREGLERSLAALRREVEIRAIRNGYTLLTPRERQVMALVVLGLLNKQVGGELGISELTVKAHRGQVMQKMKANSLADLVRMAAKLGPEHAAGGKCEHSLEIQVLDWRGLRAIHHRLDHRSDSPKGSLRRAIGCSPRSAGC